jgi:formylglycine-generating enzyme required for sulfatase activity
MAGKIFINYRRDDVADGAARVHDALAAVFGKSNMFMDIDNLLAGQRFDRELAKALADCDVLVAIIGPRWMELLQTKAKSDDERDYVREEIAEALKRDIVVIPVRVGREGQMPPLPKSADLPPDIRDLVHYQKHDVAHEHFGQNIQSLVTAIRSVRKSKQPRIAFGRIAIAVIGVLAVAWVGAHFAGGPSVVTDTSLERERQARLNAESDAQRLRDEAVAKRKAEEAAAAEARRRAEEARLDPGLAIRPGSGQSFRDNLASGQPCPTCPEMVVVPAGSFTMGSPSDEPRRVNNEGPQHNVTISKPFAVGRYAVTFDEWDACVTDGGCNGYRPDDKGWGRGRRPVINVNWDDAKSYVAWLSRKGGKPYRLLSEAEREYVTRAGTTTPFWWGSSISASQANYDSDYTYDAGSTVDHRQATGDYREKTVPVDSFQPNPWGLYQVHGNVLDWVEDCYHDSYVGAPSDGSAWTTGDCKDRVLRGGSWVHLPKSLRAADRFRDKSDVRYYYFGFRLGRTLTP